MVTGGSENKEGELENEGEETMENNIKRKRIHTEKRRNAKKITNMSPPVGYSKTGVIFEGNCC